MTAFLYRRIIEHTTDAVVVTQAETFEKPAGPRIVYVNDAYLQMTGYSRDEVIGKTPRILQGPETDRKELDKLRYAIEHEQPGRAEVINYRKSGEKFWTSISIFPILNDKGQCMHWIGIKRDITELKNSEQMVVDSLKEKETLFQEVQHRVRNNLAVILGIVELKAMELEDQDCLPVLEELGNRIHSLAVCQKLLYQYQNPHAIPIHECIRLQLKSMFNENGNRPGIRTTLDQIFLNINQAIPFGFIFSEILLLSKRKPGDTFNVDIRLALMNGEAAGARVALTSTITNLSSGGSSLRKKIEREILQDPITGAYVRQLRGDWKLDGGADSLLLKFEFDKSSRSGSSAHKLL